MMMAERLAARLLVGGRPGPLLEAVRAFLPAWAKHLSDHTGHAFTVGAEKPAQVRGQKALSVELVSRYDAEDDLRAVFVLGETGLTLMVTHRGKTHVYPNVSPRDLPTDQLIEDLKIEVGPDTIVWVGHSVMDVTVVGLDEKEVLAHLKADAVEASQNAFEEAWGDPREVERLRRQHDEVDPDTFRADYEERSPQAEKLVRQWTRITDVVHPERKPLGKVLSGRALEEATQALTSGYTYRV